MKRFEYKVVEQLERSSFSEVTDRLNECGAYGWELCSVDKWCFIFKREIRTSEVRDNDS